MTMLNGARNWLVRQRSMLLYCLILSQTACVIEFCGDFFFGGSGSIAPAIIEQNLGQADPRYRYYAGSGRMAVVFNDEGVTFDSQGKASVRLILDGGNEHIRVASEDERIGKVNYFLGKDASKWIRDARTFGRLRYRGVYKGIDMVYHAASEDRGGLEQDFEVAPGADPYGPRLVRTRR